MNQADTRRGFQLAQRIVDLLSRLEERWFPSDRVDWGHDSAATCMVSSSGNIFLRAVPLAPTSLDDLIGIEDQSRLLLSNLRAFLDQKPCNHMLLSGARGTGKSSMVRAALNSLSLQGLRLVELHREHIGYLTDVAHSLALVSSHRFVILMDDLGFDNDDSDYRTLKAILDGSVGGLSDNVMICVTSNRRHLMPEYQWENQQARIENGMLHLAEASEDKLALADRFGLWLRFHPMNQVLYLEAVACWINHWRHEPLPDMQWEEVNREALRWALARGGRSGRCAEQFARHWVGVLEPQKPGRIIPDDEPS